MLKTINAKLIISIGFITILIFGIFSYLFITHQNSQLISEVFRGANIFIDTVTRSTRYDMLMDDREDVHQMIENIGAQPGVEFVRIFNKEGKIMFSTNKGEMNTFVDKNAEACYVCHSAQQPLQRLSSSERSRIFQGKYHRVLSMIRPIYNEPDCYTAACHAHPKAQRVLGVLDIGMSLADVDNELKQNQLMFIVFTLFTILSFSIVLAFFVHRLVTRPVRNIVVGTKKIADGDMDVKIPVKTGDEIGLLALSFNQMVDDLKKAHLQIQSWNIELERKVEERTKNLQMAREQLIQSEKMASLGVLASSVAHEINNPLQGILTYIKLMLKIINGKTFEQKKLENFKDYLGLMGNEIERCGGMVKNLLVFSKQTRINIQELDINTVIENSLKLLENKIKLQNIEVILELSKNVHPVLCDEKQIQQTLIAIIINSVEAMPEGGTLKIVSKDTKDPFVEVIISDTGSGISIENQKKIFDPFFTTKEDCKSTGLGLFVAYGIIREHQGSIKVDSKPGEGTTFYIQLPINKVG